MTAPTINVSEQLLYLCSRDFGSHPAGTNKVGNLKYRKREECSVFKETSGSFVPVNKCS